VTLTVLNVAYPLAPVGPDAVGGSEQILTQLDRALTVAGHRSIVIACEGSQTAGELVAVPRITGDLDQAAVARARERHAAAIKRVLRRHRVDVIHLHGIDFHTYLPPPVPPVLATLHLPVSWYPREALLPGRPGTWVNCVSQSQHQDLQPNPLALAPIENGVEVSRARHAKRRFALLLSRICTEKGVHLAIDAAKQANMPLLIGGEVFPYPEHCRYFEEDVRPRLDRWRRFLGPIGQKRKRRLLAAARCVLIPSLVAETSSLVAREALAAGTPVIAFPSGALTETIEHGRTGFLVEGVEAMSAAILRANVINPEVCRAVAAERFSLARMTAAYLEVYHWLARLQFAGAA
jgi:glycosyltransferase involved in cell wall biosynthesis